MIDRIERSELLTPQPVEALAGLFDVAEPSADEGLPLLWHWLYLLERPSQAQLGPDGHPAGRCIPEPPGPGRRRMFAGGRVTVHRPLFIGAQATRSTYVRDSREKLGRSGRLTFVTVAHDIRQDGHLTITEEQDIVYRDARSEGTSSPPGPGSEAWGSPTGPDAKDADTGEPITLVRAIDPVLLFRFSALTYNAHRIHYDRAYATGVEGHPGLVVHGPLQAMLMAEIVRGRLPSAAGRIEMTYRLTAPMYDIAGPEIPEQLIATGLSVADGGFETRVQSRRGHVTAWARIATQSAPD